MTDEKIIEVEVTAEDLEKMRAEGISESELPAVGIKRYRAARHIVRNTDKVTVLLDADIAEHFKKRAASENTESFQVQINQELRQIMERQKV